MMTIKREAKVYFAGLDLTKPSSCDLSEKVNHFAYLMGMKALIPLDQEINFDLINEADIVIANLNDCGNGNPDSGVVFLVGFAAGQGKSVIVHVEDAAQYRYEASDNRTEAPDPWRGRSNQSLKVIMKEIAALIVEGDVFKAISETGKHHKANTLPMK